jgi:P-type E1-E2 ATPase
MGDGENDVEMLQMASIGVAVGNAGPLAQEASDFVMTETNDEGGAGAAMEVFGFGLY